MSDFLPYLCTLGAVIDHEEHAYIIATPDGRIVGIPANAQPSPEAIETDIASPPAAPAPVPHEVPMWAIRAILDLAGLTSSINSILSQLAEPQRTIVLRVWEYGNYIRRDSPTIASLTAALGKTDAEVDAYFREASALNP